MAPHGARRLTPMARNASNVIAIEAIVAAQACDFHAPLRSSAALEGVRSKIRENIPHLEEDRYLHSDLTSAGELVLQGELIASAGAIDWPKL